MHRMPLFLLPSLLSYLYKLYKNTHYNLCLILVYRYRIKSLTDLLNKQARAVNFVWNYCNDREKDALRYGRKWLTGFDLNVLTTGSSKELGLHSGTVNATCEQYAKSRVWTDQRQCAGCGKSEDFASMSGKFGRVSDAPVTKSEVGMEELLAQCIEAAKRKGDQGIERQARHCRYDDDGKAVAGPTDSALLERSREHSGESGAAMQPELAEKL